MSQWKKWCDFSATIQQQCPWWVSAIGAIGFSIVVVHCIVVALRRV